MTPMELIKKHTGFTELKDLVEIFNKLNTYIIKNNIREITPELILKVNRMDRFQIELMPQKIA